VLHQSAISTSHFFCVGSRCEPLQGLRKPLPVLHIEVGAILNRLGLWIAVPDVRDQRGDLDRVVYGLSGNISQIRQFPVRMLTRTTIQTFCRGA